MFLIITTNLEVTIIRQFLPKQVMLDNFYKPLNHKFYIITWYLSIRTKAQEFNTQTENSLFHNENS